MDKFKKKFSAQKRNNILILVFSLIVFCFYAAINLNLNIHGDAKFHTLSAITSAGNGYLTDHQAYRVFKMNPEIEYMPIAYPLSYEALFTTLYIFGGETLLKLYSAIFATLIFIYSYLCLKEIGFYKSIVISFIAVLTIGERLFMTPLIEPYMIVLLLIGMYIFKLYLMNNQLKYLFLCALFFGAAAAIKQQGLILGTGVSGFVFLYLIMLVIKSEYKLKKAIFAFIFYFIIFLSVPFLALADQSSRTGTIGFSPGGTKINSNVPYSEIIQPYLISTYPVNPSAIEAIKSTVGYNKLSFSFFDKLRGFTLSPFIYYYSNSNLLFSKNNYIFSSILLVIIMLAVISLIRSSYFRNNKIFLLFMIFIFLVELTESYVFRTPITQYHSFGVIILVYLLFFSLFTFTKNRKIKTFVFSLVTAFYIIGYFQYIYPLWFSNGREDNYQIEAYKRIGSYIGTNIDSDAIFLAGETSFRYYARRNTIWLNESIGDKVKTVIDANDEEVAINKLKQLNIDYIVINKLQTTRSGVGDYLPPEGLYSILDKSSHFTKLYDPYNDNNFSLYKINYE